jgi:hypothetical protein
MWFICSIELLILGDDLIIVLAFAIADVVVRQQFVGEVVVVNNFYHDSAENDHYT